MKQSIKDLIKHELHVVREREKRYAKPVAVGAGLIGSPAASMAVFPAHTKLYNNVNSPIKGLSPLTDSETKSLADKIKMPRPYQIRNDMPDLAGARYMPSASGDMIHLGKQTPPHILAHELGHATHNRTAFEMAGSVLGRNPLLPIATTVAGGMMAYKGKKGGLARKLAIPVALSGAAPTLYQEGMASVRGMSALKSVKQFAPEQYGEMKHKLMSAWGTYALPLAAATAGPVAGVLAYRKYRDWKEKKHEKEHRLVAAGKAPLPDELDHIKHLVSPNYGLKKTSEAKPDQSYVLHSVHPKKDGVKFKAIFVNVNGKEPLVADLHEQSKPVVKGRQMTYKEKKHWRKMLAHEQRFGEV